MPKNYSRADRVGDLIQTALAEIIQREGLGTRFGLVTLVDVKVSPDFSHAKIYASVLPEEKAAEAIAELNDAAKDLRYHLAHTIKIRITPNLKFFYDDSAVRGSHISSLIDNALKKIKHQD